MFDVERFDQVGGISPASGASFDPLSEVEVSAIEKKFGVELPEAYRDFLTSIGAAAFDEIVRCSAGEVDYFYGKPFRSKRRIWS